MFIAGTFHKFSDIQFYFKDQLSYNICVQYMYNVKALIPSAIILRELAAQRNAGIPYSPTRLIYNSVTNAPLRILNWNRRRQLHFSNTVTTSVSFVLDVFTFFLLYIITSPMVHCAGGFFFSLLLLSVVNEASAHAAGSHHPCINQHRELALNAQAGVLLIITALYLMLMYDSLFNHLQLKMNGRISLLS